MGYAWLRRTAALAAIALAATSCGGGDDDKESAAPSTGGPTDSQQNEDELAEVWSVDDPAVIRAGELAAILVDALDDDETALGAVLFATDAGYDISQIEAAIVDGTLGANGSVAEVKPALEAPRRIAEPPDVEETASETEIVIGNAAYQTSQNTNFVITPAMVTQDGEPIYIERLRRGAAELATADDLWPTGRSGTALILAWHFHGFSDEQIFDALIFGGGILDEFPGSDCSAMEIGGQLVVAEICQLIESEQSTDATGDADNQASEAGSNDQATEDGSDAGEECGLPSDLSLPLEANLTVPDSEGFNGTLSLADDGTFTIELHSERFVDITIRDAPDQQHYKEDWNLSGAWELAPATTGTATGEHNYYFKGWSDQPQPLEFTDPTTGTITLQADGTIDVLVEQDTPENGHYARWSETTVPCG